MKAGTRVASRRYCLRLNQQATTRQCDAFFTTNEQVSRTETHETTDQQSLQILTPWIFISPPPFSPLPLALPSTFNHPTNPSSTSSHLPLFQSATTSSEHVSFRGFEVVGMRGTGVAGRAQTIRPQRRQWCFRLARLKEDLRKMRMMVCLGQSTGGKEGGREERMGTDVQIGHFFTVESSSHFTIPCSAAARTTQPDQRRPPRTTGVLQNSPRFDSTLAPEPPNPLPLVDDPTLLSFNPLHRSPGFFKLSKSSKKAEDERRAGAFGAGGGSAMGVLATGEK